MVSQVYLGSNVASTVDRAYLGSTIIFQREANDADVQNLLDTATSKGYSLPSQTTIDALNTFFTTLKSINAWTRLERLYILVTDGDENFALLNAKSPSDLEPVNNGVSFTSLEGFTGNGSDEIDLNFTALDLSNYSSTSGSYGVYVRAIGTLNSYWLGAGPNDQIRRNNSANVTPSLRSNNISYTAVLPLGLYNLSRSNDSSLSLFINDSITQTSGSTSSTTPNPNFALFGRLDDPAGKSDATLGLFYAGGDLSDIKNDFYNAVQTYMTALGANV